jgi:hypothetical protein
MNANLITALAGVLGSVSGASAAIATTWISQKSQTVRERGKWETRKRETLYGDFITEASHLVADAFDHSLDKPETLVKLYAHLGVSGSSHQNLCSLRLKNVASASSICTRSRTERSTRSTRSCAARNWNSSIGSARPAASSFAGIPPIDGTPVL